MFRFLLLIIAFVFFSFGAQAQFHKLLKKAEHAALQKVLGQDSATSGEPSVSTQEQQPGANETDQEQSNTNREDSPQQLPPPQPIDFPKTGETTEGTHCTYQWILDTAKIVQAISATEQGKYAFSLARQKGLNGTDEQLFQQLLKPENSKVMEDIEQEVEAKFPDKTAPAGYEKKQWSNGSWEGEGMIPATNPDPGNNPAWGGVSIPSLYFSTWGGNASIWLTDRYIKDELMNNNGDMPTILALYGTQATEILDLEKMITYSIGSVLGVKFTTIQPMDGSDNDSSGFRILHTIGVAKSFWPVPGIKYEQGKAGKFGPYHTVSEKLVIPVQPFTDPATGKRSDALLIFHDVLSGRHDSGPEPDHHHYDPSYKIIYEYYFTHDIDKDLPAGLLARYNDLGLGDKGFCIGVKIEDEDGNSADYRLTSIEPGQKIDKGQFQVPSDYPVMTQAQLQEAIKKQFSLKNIFKRSLQNSGSNGKD